MMYFIIMFLPPRCIFAFEPPGALRSCLSVSFGELKTSNIFFKVIIILSSVAGGKLTRQTREEPDYDKLVVWWSVSPPQVGESCFSLLLEWTNPGAHLTRQAENAETVKQIYMFLHFRPEIYFTRYRLNNDKSSEWNIFLQLHLSQGVLILRCLQANSWNSLTVWVLTVQTRHNL